MSQQQLPSEDGYPLLTARTFDSSYSLANKGYESAMVQRTPRPRRRFWKRTLVLVLIPSSVTAYFFWIWMFLLNRDMDDAVKYGRAHEQWVNYSWFVIGVFALGWSKYGLAGLEAAMLEKPFWKPCNAASLLMHSDNSWSGPGGWAKGLKSVPAMLQKRERFVHRLWLLLAFLSFLPFLALSLSGLCLELSDGYRSSNTKAMVVGRTWSNFNNKDYRTPSPYAPKGWAVGSPPALPGIGILYTTDAFDRNQFEGLSRVPNTMPLEGGPVEVFLAPQSTSPVSGRAWGLRANYTCTIVKDVAEFTILSQRSTSTFFSNSSQPDGTKKTVRLSQEKDHIQVFTGSDSKDALNIYGHVEMGVRSGGARVYSPLGDPNSLDNIFEILLWQRHSRESYNNTDLRFNVTVEPAVEGVGQPFIKLANGTYAWNETFYQVQKKSGSNVTSIVDLLDVDENPPRSATTTEKIISLAPPIGVRCQVTSHLGTAQLDPTRSVFHSFIETPEPLMNASTMEYRTPLLGKVAEGILSGQYHEILTSINAPPPVAFSNSLQYRNFVQPQMLLRSVMLAYGHDALQIMYENFGLENAREHENLTSSTTGKLLTPGVVDPVVPASVLAIWAASCLVLGLWYGFQPRWADSLNGYEFFRFGVGAANEVRNEADYASAREFQQIRVLASLPGSIREGTT
jgi:hypothetical protein